MTMPVSSRRQSSVRRRGCRPRSHRPPEPSWPSPAFRRRRGRARPGPVSLSAVSSWPSDVAAAAVLVAGARRSARRHRRGRLPPPKSEQHVENGPALLRLRLARRLHDECSQADRDDDQAVEQPVKAAAAVSAAHAPVPHCSGPTSKVSLRKRTTPLFRKALRQDACGLRRN